MPPSNTKLFLVMFVCLLVSAQLTGGILEGSMLDRGDRGEEGEIVSFLVYWYMTKLLREDSI